MLLLDLKRAKVLKAVLSVLLLLCCVHILVSGAKTANATVLVTPARTTLSGHLERDQSANANAYYSQNSIYSSHRQTRDNNNSNNNNNAGRWTTATTTTIEPTSATNTKLHNPSSTTNQLDDGDDRQMANEIDGDEIYLETMEDLDHLSYLAMRNYNLTDERLLQSAWLIGGPLGGPMGAHKQHAEDESSAGSLAASDPKSRLSLMLESLILHLRNGHLQRLDLDELEQIINGQNLTESLDLLRSSRRRHSIIFGANGVGPGLKSDHRRPLTSSTDDSPLTGADNHRRLPSVGGDPSQSAPTPGGEAVPPTANGDASELSADYDGEMRCIFLVTLYKFELTERMRSQTTMSGGGGAGALSPAGTSTSSKVEYESVPAVQSRASQQYNERILSKYDQMSLVADQQQSEGSTANSTAATSSTSTVSPQRNPEAPSQPESQSPPSTQTQPQDPPAQVDESRLMRLCKLAVSCRSSDELVSLISRPWKASNTEYPNHKGEERHETRKRTGSTSNPGGREDLEREMSPTADYERAELEGPNQGLLEAGAGNSRELQRSEQESTSSSNRLRYRKNIRDSVSLSLAKLCPLILFPLHEDDGKCMVRRDDRPPMITVWAFATLFVTIVCFCSLIGLSITPLIGHSGGADSSTAGDSDTSGPAVFKYLPNFLFGSRLSPVQTGGLNDKYRHKASLTLFEGLAVGSLVGSALFSLIPQAFELQERESNQSFLLKAFIIFSGIYLFFLSERIMRIILDTRQKRKRKKRITHRSSTTAAAEMPAEAHPHHPHHPHQHLLETAEHQQHPPLHNAAHYQHHNQSMLNHPPPGGGSLRQHSISNSRPSTSSRGSCGGKQRAMGTMGAQTGQTVASMVRLPKKFEVLDHGIELETGPHSAAYSTRNQKFSTTAATTTASGGGRKDTKTKHRSASKLHTRQLTDDDHEHHSNQHHQPQRSVKERQLAQRQQQPLAGEQYGRQYGKKSGTATTARSKSSSYTRGGPGKRARQKRKISAATAMSRNPSNHHQSVSGDKRRRQERRIEKSQANERKLKKSAKATGGIGNVRGSLLRPESDPDDHFNLHQQQLVGSSSEAPSYSSSTSSCSSSSFVASHHLLHQTRGRSRRVHGTSTVLIDNYNYNDDDSRNEYSSHSESESASVCSSCSSIYNHHEYCKMLAPDPSDSDDDNDQRRAVTKRMSELSHRIAASKQQQQVAPGSGSPSPMSPTRTTFDFDADPAAEQLEPQALLRGYGHHGPTMGSAGPSYLAPSSEAGAYRSERRHHHASGQHTKERDISTVAWMIILGDGLHNFIDGISIGAAFSESILSGVSISVAVICEEFPHELGDFAVLVSSGMTIRQALGYNFLSACTCYLGMAVGIILGDVTDGASYISALAAGVFLYIALVDMMGELSAALEASSRDSIARTLKLLLLQNIGIAIGISIIFVLSFIDF